MCVSTTPNHVNNLSKSRLDDKISMDLHKNHLPIAVMNEKGRRVLENSVCRDLLMIFASYLTTAL